MNPPPRLTPRPAARCFDWCGRRRSLGQTVIFSGHVLSEVEAVSDRVAILRRGRLMHIEDMHARRSLRMLLIKFADKVPAEFPAELELTVRERKDQTLLLEHRGQIGPLLHWLDMMTILDLAIGTEDLHSLYDRFHGPDAIDEEMVVSS